MNKTKDISKDITWLHNNIDKLKKLLKLHEKNLE